jgi:hypothetical protein
LFSKESKEGVKQRRGMEERKEGDELPFYSVRGEKEVTEEGRQRRNLRRKVSVIMPPKKREKDNESSKSSRIDQIQADHELFLQAFESKLIIFVHVLQEK